MRVTLPDDVVDPYVAMATAQGRSVDEVITAQLRRFKELPPGKKAIVLRADALQHLEAPLGGTPLATDTDLVRRVNQLANVSFEGLNIGLSISQKEELAHRARRQGKAVQQLVSEIWAFLAQNFFHHAAASEAHRVANLPVAPPAVAPQAEA
jgi:hypothetical protein